MLMIQNEQLRLNVKARVYALAQAGVDKGDIAKLITHDLFNNGPIKKAYERSVKTVLKMHVIEQMRLGESDCHCVLSLPRVENISKIKTDALDYDGRVKRFKKLAKAIITATNSGESALVREGFSSLIDYTWIAELKNTCHRCLPLHGSVLTLKEWRKRGKMPAVIHADWASVCHCRMVPNTIAARLPDLIKPLRRVKQRGVVGTRRAIESKNEERASKGAVKAKQSLNGRRALRVLGQANAKK